MVRDITGLMHFDGGVTEVPLSTDQPPTTLASTQYHLCGVVVAMLQQHSRFRTRCESAAGRYVFVRWRPSPILSMSVCEMEVYVQCECLRICPIVGMRSCKQDPLLGSFLKFKQNKIRIPYMHPSIPGTNMLSERVTHTCWFIDWDIGILDGNLVIPCKCSGGN